MRIVHTFATNAGEAQQELDKHTRCCFIDGVSWFHGVNVEEDNARLSLDIPGLDVVDSIVFHSGRRGGEVDLVVGHNNNDEPPLAHVSISGGDDDRITFVEPLPVFMLDRRDIYIKMSWFHYPLFVAFHGALLSPVARCVARRPKTGMLISSFAIEDGTTRGPLYYVARRGLQRYKSNVPLSEDVDFIEVH